MVRPRPALIAVLVATALLVAGCAETPSALISAGNGATTIGNTITEIKPDSRGKPVTFGGPLGDGSTADSRTWLGSPMVVNFWYASCPPCRVEAPDLVALDKTYSPQGVVFVGVNVRDEAATAGVFETTFKIPYSSILDARKGAVQLAFAGQIAPDAVPTTLVLDRQGRVAARIIGKIPARSILSTLISDVLNEKAIP
jgi:thiol-disulfide isomerase/thioredoxin